MTYAFFVIKYTSMTFPLIYSAHQLRGPNSIISGYASMLLDGDFGELTELQKTAIQHIFNSSTNLNNVINELLDTNRIDQKKMKYSEIEFDVAETIRESLCYYRGIAKKKRVKIIEDLNKTNSHIMKGDKEKIRQAFMNLLDNSFKYTNKGFIKITLNKENKKIIFTIEDTGIGIKKDEQCNLFNKFVRASNAEVHCVVGSGLGLYVVKEIVEANKGKIIAESDGENLGSKFTITFPAVA
jgi:signal transduction histidine kinase